jgi:hypothetical protein
MRNLTDGPSNVTVEPELNTETAETEHNYSQSSKD